MYVFYEKTICRTLNFQINYISSRLLTVQTFEDHKVPLYSINSHPLKSHEFCVSGRDHLVRIYDQRKLHHVMSTFFPGHIKKVSINILILK